MYENLDYVLVNGQFIPATNPFYYCSSLTDREQYTMLPANVLLCSEDYMYFDKIYTKLERNDLGDYVLSKLPHIEQPNQAAVDLINSVLPKLIKANQESLRAMYEKNKGELDDLLVFSFDEPMAISQDLAQDTRQVLQLIKRSEAHDTKRLTTHLQTLYNWVETAARQTNAQDFIGGDYVYLALKDIDENQSPANAIKRQP